MADVKSRIGSVGRSISRRENNIFTVRSTEPPAHKSQGHVMKPRVNSDQPTPEAEAALHESDRRLRLITDAMPALIAYCDRDVIYRFCNAAYEEWFGLTLDQIVGQRLVDVIGAEAFDRVKPYVDRALAGERVRFEQLLPYSHGPPRHVQVDYIAHRDSDGSVAGFYAMIQDVTDRKAADSEIHRQQERLERMIDSAEIGIGFGDSEGRIYRVNQAFAQITGYDRDELMSRRIGWNDLTAPEYAELDRRMMTQLQDSGSAGPWEKEYIRKDGSRVPIVVSCTALQGGADEHVAFVLDLTDRRRAEQAQRDANSRLTAIVETAADGIMTIDESGSIESVNSAMTRIFGYSEDELIGRHVAILMPEPFSEEHDAYVARYLRTGQRKVIGVGREVIGLRKDGTVFPIELSVSEMRLGKRRLFTGILRDITDRKRAEVELKHLNEALEKRVEQRTGMIRLLHEAASACHHATTLEEAVTFVLREFAQYNSWCFAQAYRPLETVAGKLLLMAEYYEQTPGSFAALRRATRACQFTCDVELPGQVWRKAEPDIVNHITQSSSTRRDVMQQLGIRGWAAFPAMVGDEVVAVLEFFSEKPVEKEDRLVRCMVNLGVQLGRVVERQRLERQIAEITSHEQQRIGQELHDTVAQLLTGAQMMSASLVQRLDAESSPLRQQANRIGEVIKDAQEQVRRLSRGLMPVEVDATGLMNALLDLADQTERMHGICCTFDCKGEVLVKDNATATQLYRIAQEAIHNAVKHARPSRVVVTLSAGERIQLTIRDDGVGIQQCDTDRSGAGLRIMRYRSEIIGGRLTVETAPQKGTAITCTLLET